MRVLTVDSPLQGICPLAINNNNNNSPLPFPKVLRREAGGDGRDSRGPRSHSQDPLGKRTKDGERRPTQTVGAFHHRSSPSAHQIPE